MEDTVERRRVSQVTTGMVVITIGLVLLAGQLNLAWIGGVAHLWPIVLVVIGVGHLITGSDSRSSGLWFLFLGGLFLMHTTGVLRLHDSWPLFVVAAGVSMMFKQKGGRDDA
jgi:hypothetical protein